MLDFKAKSIRVCGSRAEKVGPRANFILLLIISLFWWKIDMKLRVELRIFPLILLKNYMRIEPAAKITRKKIKSAIIAVYFHSTIISLKYLISS